MSRIAVTTGAVLVGALALALPAGAGATPTTSGFSAGAVAGQSPFDAPGVGSQAYGAYKLFRHAPHWRRGRIRYYNAAKENRLAVREAVKAWNTSGAKVRFVAVPRRRARLVIQYWPKSRGCVPLGYAVTGAPSARSAPRAKVVISRPYPEISACSRWALELVTAHELGHVLGLDHEKHKCALMNTQIDILTPALCPPQPEWRWRCRVLEPDDVKGAVRLYGGHVKPRPQPVCDLVSPPRIVTDLKASVSEPGSVDVSFGRTTSSDVPPHMLGGPVGGYVAEVGDEGAGCPSQTTDQSGSPWTVPVGGVQRDSLVYADGGHHCIAVWSVDPVGRLSPPATLSLDLPPSEP